MGSGCVCALGVELSFWGMNEGLFKPQRAQRAQREDRGTESREGREGNEGGQGLNGRIREAEGRVWGSVAFCVGRCVRRGKF